MGKAFEHRVQWLRGMEQVLREERGVSSEIAAVLADVCLGLMETGLRLHTNELRGSSLLDVTAEVFTAAERSLR